MWALESDFEILKQTIRSTNQLELSVDGISMEPLINLGASIKVEYIQDIQKLKRFDIIVILLNNKLICHYLWNKNTSFTGSEMMISTRPLNPISGKDPPINARFILGRVTNYQITLYLKTRILINLLIKRVV